MKPTKHNIQLTKQFVAYCAENLGLAGSVNVTLSLESQGDMPTAGHFDPQKNLIVVSVKNRAMADCFRTIAHELTHRKQAQDGVEFPSDDEGLQPLEDEANVMAGRLVRFFGRENPGIYEDLR